MQGLSPRARTGIAGAATLVLMVLLVLPSAALAIDQKLTAGDAYERFGTAVALDGDTAVVGAEGADGRRGAVYVFRRFGDGWTQVARLTASDGAVDDRLGFSVAIDGDTIVAGAPGPAAGPGSVYVFSRTGPAARTQIAKLTTSAGGGLLGHSVAIDGDTIVAGAPTPVIGSGAAYTFARTGPATRTQTATLTASDGAVGDHLGYSVAIDGDTIVAGAAFDDGENKDNQGSAYTFARTGPAARSETAKLTASDGAAHDVLGVSAAIDGDTIVLGAYGDDAGANEDQGSAYTFSRTGLAARSETAKLTASDGAAHDVFGVSAAIDGDTIVVGAPRGDAGAITDQGSAYTFSRTGPAARTQIAELTASDGASGDTFGLGVAIEGDTIVAGDPVDDVGANAEQGSATIFFAAAPPPPAPSPTTPDPTPTPTPPPGPAPTTPAPAPTAVGPINGTPGNDTINGTPGNDVINCGAGNDVVNGGGGDDVINGGAGDDRVSGDGGNDTVRGESGNDVLSGGEGNDTISGGSGSDRASGGSGDDRVTGDSGRDRLSGGRGNDVLSGGSGSDRLAGDSGNDRLSGGPGRDRLSGGPGRDRERQ